MVGALTSLLWIPQGMAQPAPPVLLYSVSGTVEVEVGGKARTLTHDDNVALLAGLVLQPADSVTTTDKALARIRHRQYDVELDARTILEVELPAEEPCLTLQTGRLYYKSHGRPFNLCLRTRG